MASTDCRRISLNFSDPNRSNNVITKSGSLRLVQSALQYVPRLFPSDDHHTASVPNSDLHLIIYQDEIPEAPCAVWEVYLRHTTLPLRQKPILQALNMQYLLPITNM